MQYECKSDCRGSLNVIVRHIIHSFIVTLVTGYDYLSIKKDFQKDIFEVINISFQMNIPIKVAISLSIKDYYVIILYIYIN